MSKTNEEKNLTARYMIGKWVSKGDNTDITIEISERSIAIAGFVKGESVETLFDNSNWWVGDYLFFTSEPRFYIHYATETYLGFGELVIPGLMGEVKWGFRFDRVE